MEKRIRNLVMALSVGVGLGACVHSNTTTTEKPPEKSVKNSQHEEEVRALASIPDDEFADRLGEIGITGVTEQDIKTLKSEYQANKDLPINHHGRYLTCTQAGEDRERPLELYEQCDRDGEKEKFLELGRRIQVVQEKNRKNHAVPEKDGKYAFRGFHAKSHGCLYGTLKVTDPQSRPEWTRNGVFAQSREYLAWTRFSNGTGLIQGDYKAEPRGLAIKLMGVEGPRASLHGVHFEKQTQDFLMTNKPFATTPDPETFIEFAEANADGTMPKFIKKNPWIFPIFGDLILNKRWISNVGTITYWSGVPISMGKTNNNKPIPVKFFAEPCQDAPYMNDEQVQADPSFYSRLVHKKDHVNYGRDWLKKLTRKYDICYDLKFQIQTDVDKTSVEDGLDIWTPEESTPITVGQLILPKQYFDTPEQNRLCERMRFNPWNAIEDHLPMSDTNQARGIVYLKSAEHRTGKDWTKTKAPVEPLVKDHPLYRQVYRK